MDEGKSSGSLKKKNRVISQDTIFQYGDELSTLQIS